jgi:hypothetical protein
MKWYSWYKLYVFNDNGDCSFPVRSYNSLEEAFQKAEEIWSEMKDSVRDDDIIVEDSTKMVVMVNSDKIEQYVKKNKCQDVKIGTEYRGKKDVTWKNTTYVY